MHARVSGVHRSQAKPSAPRVSVVIAAYNSSIRLRCAVQSALQQSFEDIEVIVVGDSCTDDSEGVLRSMREPRIQWENLATNWGEQSIPSNRGIELARGDFIFFLNQDDLWLPNHVAESLLMLEDLKLDAVWSPFLTIPADARPGAVRDGLSIKGLGPAHPRYDPHTFIPASCTAWRAGALRRIGGWRTAAEVGVSPSQDLLWRARGRGLSIRGKAQPTVLVLWSGVRPGSYLTSFQAEDNISWLEAITLSPSVVVDEIQRAMNRSQLIRHRQRQLSSNLTALIRVAQRKHYFIRIIVFRLIGLFSEAIGMHPKTAEVMWIYRRQGGFINHVRSINKLGRRDAYHQLLRRRK